MGQSQTYEAQHVKLSQPVKSDTLIHGSRPMLYHSPCFPQTTVGMEAEGLVVMLLSEEDKRATTNVQNCLVFFFLLSFILLSSPFVSLT